MERTIRWGILGTGNIAGAFAAGLKALDDAALVAVGSRSPESAAAFGERHGVARRYGSYEALVADPELDVIYVASPHSEHLAHSLLCLRAGKAVLCEKPLTVNAAEAATLVSEARALGLFLMEAMWTRFLPHFAELRRLLAAGAIGEPRMLNASFCFRANYNPHSRLFDPALAGGALLDVGIYPAALAALVFGRPAAVVSAAHLAPTGVDEQSAAILSYPDGQLAIIAAASRTAMAHDAVIAGTEGSINLHTPWWQPSGLTLVRPGEPERAVVPAHVGNGYNYQAAEVMRCLRAGLTESELMPLDESVATMATLDAIRAPWGLRYPGE